MDKLEDLLLISEEKRILHLRNVHKVMYPAAVAYSFFLIFDNGHLASTLKVNLGLAVTLSIFSCIGVWLGSLTSKFVTIKHNKIYAEIIKKINSQTELGAPIYIEVININVLNRLGYYFYGAYRPLVRLKSDKKIRVKFHYKIDVGFKGYYFKFPIKGIISNIFIEVVVPDDLYIDSNKSAA